MMLYPAMTKLNEEIPNRYLLVNMVARRARQISENAEDIGERLDEKAVTIAIHEVADGDHRVDPVDLYEALNKCEIENKKD